MRWATSPTAGTCRARPMRRCRGCGCWRWSRTDDLGMLKTCGYPYCLQQRIASDQGHLSNAQAAAELERLLHSGLEAVAAMHVSQESNTYGIPRRTLGEVLAREEHPAHLHVAYQSQLVSVG